MWKIQAHRKIILFLWQCMHDRIPVNSQLGIRGVSSSPECPLYALEVETIDHLLYSCAFARLVWKLCPLQIDFSSSALTMWKKNGLIYVPVGRHMLFQLIVRVWRRVSGGYPSKNLLLLPVPSVPVPIAVWTTPAFGCFKLNFDAAFNSSCHFCGGGAILRDHLGRPVKVASFFMLNVSSPSLAESLFSGPFSYFCIVGVTGMCWLKVIVNLLCNCKSQWRVR
ncbi:uncharacterized protein LOC132304888 [Cornus florida]|uniref:uncharacterized protein LOC132304888 n=1 Tax=Cornus florida TaxID=4283 RepID=UPI00289FC289|nr:uncharacterized protein LOC132304888 [Cornus florida]